MKKWSLFANVVLLSTLALILFGSNTNSSEAETETKNPTTKTTSAAQHDADLNLQNVKSIPLPDALSLAGEQVPMHRADIRESLDRELLVNAYWHSNTIQNIKLAQKYFPIIEPILAKHGIPDDFKYLAVIESGLRNVGSPAGAKGIWQFMKATAKEYKLEVATEVDERYHLEKSTEAACKYLSKAYAKFGNWTLAAAAYNAGSSRVQTQLSKQFAGNYYDLYLNSETARYVFRILAVKLIMSQPEKYGFDIASNEGYHMNAYNTETVKAIGSIPDFARQHNVSYKELKLMNPWLRDTKLSARSSGKQYEIKIPL